MHKETMFRGRLYSHAPLHNLNSIQLITEVPLLICDFSRNPQSLAVANIIRLISASDIFENSAVMHT